MRASCGSRGIHFYCLASLALCSLCSPFFFSGFFGVLLTTDYRGALHLGSEVDQGYFESQFLSAALQDLEPPHHPWTWDEWIEHQKTI